MAILKTLARRLRLAWNMLAHEKDFVIYRRDLHAHHKLSFSQEGEDMVLAEFLGRQSSGFFVDIGAHHPQRFSNTYALYLGGWRGINIEPEPLGCEQFTVVRPADKTLTCGVSTQEGELLYFQFNEPALNTFSEELARQRNGKGSYRMIAQRTVPTLPLATILDRWLPAGQDIDVLNIDAEGMDLEILQSNDWSRFRPHFVLVEDLAVHTLDALADSDIVAFMGDRGYRPIAKTRRTLFFADDRTR